MKKLAFLMLISLGLSGQTFLSFPDSNARWVNTYATLNTSLPIFQYDLQYTVKFCLGASDTVINAQKYSKVFYCGDSISYFGALRDTAAMVFFVPADSSEALMIYNFNLQAGDTLEGLYSLKFGNYSPLLKPEFEEVSNPFNPITVQQVDTVFSARGAQRVVYLNACSGYWIEGIGNSQGLFWDPFYNISNFQIKLACMSDADSTYFNGDQSLPYVQALAGQCDLTFSLAEAGKQDLQVYPNPSLGELGLSLLEPGTLKIYKSSGELVEEVHYYPNEKLNLAHLPTGIYILSLPNGKARWLKL